MTALTYGEARPEDLDAVIAISAITHREHQDRLPEAFPAGLDNELDGLFREHFAPRKNGGAYPVTRLILCREGGKIVGHVFLRVQRLNRQSEHHDVVGTVMDISILPDYRQRGIGSRLIEEARAAMREMGATRLDAHIWRGNHASAATFARQGFEPLYGLYVQRLSDPRSGRVTPDEDRALRPSRAMVWSLALNLLLVFLLFTFRNR